MNQSLAKQQGPGQALSLFTHHPFQSERLMNASKTILLIATLTTAGLAGSANAGILASWDTWDAATALDADDTATGITASVSEVPSTAVPMIHDVQTNAGSSDGTFGTTLTGADTGNGSGRMRFIKIKDTSTNGGGGDIAINITNGTGSAIQLGQLLFDLDVTLNADAAKNGYRDYSVVFVNTTQATTSAVLGSGTDLAEAEHSIDIDASSITLAAGDVGYFQLTVANAGNNSGERPWLDNVAITDVVPEPGSLALMGLGGLLIARRRRG